MAFQFPWTNLHELNLDWFLSKFKQFTNNFLETTATAESVPYTDAPSVTVTGGDLDDDTDIVDPFTFNFKIPAGQPGAQGAPGAPGAPGVPGQDGFSPIATVTKSGSVATITITDANGTTTTTISDGEVTQAQLDTKAPAIFPTINGSVVHFSDGADNLPMSELIVGITPSQSGSGDPAPDNIRPISGWTGANVTRTGKNLMDDSIKSVANGGYVFFNSTSSTIGTTATLPTGTYTFSVTYSTAFSSTKAHLNIYNTATGRRLAVKYNATQCTFTLSATTNICAFAQNSNLTANDVLTGQIEVGSTATTYEPYITPDTASISWQSEAGTVYGGALDVGTGLLTMTDGYIASYNGETLPGEWISDRDVYAPGTTPTNGAEVVYKLATPQTYQLTPQQLINTWYGVNSVWSDTGDCSVTYTADTMLYIQNLTQPTEDDMVANTAIANGKFFMIGNNLYRATTAIASGSQIIPGTNATPMSLADALNLL